MEIYLSPFELIPKVRLNRTAKLEPLFGIYLMTNEGGFRFAEYFPHVGMGDQSTLEFLKTFPDLSNQYHTKMMSYLSGPELKISDLKFFNHQLWRQGEKIISPIIKYKLLHAQDYTFLEATQNKVRVRLDANGLFDHQSYLNFRNQLAPSDIELIDYIEDPLAHEDWPGVDIPKAQDFIQGNPFEFLIYKPNRSSLPLCSRPIIYSGYMGSALGALQAYQELIISGDLKQYHGILTPGLYHNEVNVFNGSFFDGFVPNAFESNNFLKQLAGREWSYLCTI